MSSTPFIKSNPSLLVKIYDAICNYQQSHQPATTVNFLRIPELKGQDVETTVRLAEEDGLLYANPDGTYSIPPFEKSPILRFKHDSFCHTCHGSGVVLECESCWRVSHAACCPVDAPTARGKFLCSMCRQIRSAKPCPLEIKQMNRLLIFIVCILRERFKEHFLDPDRIGKAVYRNFMFKYVGFETVESRIVANYYKTPLDFLSDIQTLFHCFVLASGSESSTTADLLYNYAHYELDELEICPTCYLLSNTQPPNWFSIPCEPPHRLVFAKQKGYSYWPAKIVQTIKSDDFDSEVDSYDVRYFGGNHERAFIEPDCLKLVDSEVSKLVPKRTVTFNKAMEELSIHQKFLADGFAAYSGILNSLWELTDWAAEIENEKDRKAQLACKSNGSKAKKSRSKNTVVPTQRSTPTPSVCSAVVDSDSHDASISEFVTDSWVSGQEKDTPSRSTVSRRQQKLEESTSEKAASSVIKPSRTINGDNGKHALTRSATKTSIPSPTSAEPVLKKANNISPVSRPVILNSQEVTAGKLSKKEKAKGEFPQTKTPISTAVKAEQTSPLTPPKPQGPCPPGSLCFESYDRRLTEARQDFEKRMKQVQEKNDSERKSESSMAEKKFADEMDRLKELHKEEIAAVKKKQWCVNCSQEAFFPCCWNTAYCSQHCQQEHWYHEHKRFCRRKRPQESNANSSSTSNSSNNQVATAASGGH